MPLAPLVKVEPGHSRWDIAWTLLRTSSGISRLQPVDHTRGRKPVWYNGLGWDVSEWVATGTTGAAMGLADEKSSGDTAAVESFAAWKRVVRSERQRDLGAKPEPLLGAQLVARGSRSEDGVSVCAVGS